MAVFSVDINGRSIYSMDKMVGFIHKQYPGMPDAEKVWRFVSNFSRHKKRVTENNWHNNPLLLMNSSGGSNCGFRSAAMVNILKYMGVKARAWCLQGHVISEVFVEGKWQVYDPDLGVVYYNNQGNICSYEELCNDPDQIYHPYKVVTISGICDSITATSEENALLYKSREDNIIFNTDFSQKSKAGLITFELPPKAKLRFPVINKNGDENFAYVCLDIPAGWNGRLQIPLILSDVQGSADVYFSDIKITGGKKQISAIVSAGTQFENSLEVVNNHSGVKLFYFINPLIYHLDNKNTVLINGKNLAGLKLEICRYSKEDEPKWGDDCGSDLERWYHLANNCDEFRNQKVVKKEDYFKRLLYLNECGGFKQLDLKPDKISLHIDSVFKKYGTDADSIDWKKFNRIDYFLLSIKDILKNKPANHQ